jgi:hypothetical protein
MERGIRIMQYSLFFSGSRKRKCPKRGNFFMDRCALLLSWSRSSFEKIHFMAFLVLHSHWLLSLYIVATFQFWHLEHGGRRFLQNVDNHIAVTCKTIWIIISLLWQSMISSEPSLQICQHVVCSRLFQLSFGLGTSICVFNPLEPSGYYMYHQP